MRNHILTLTLATILAASLAGSASAAPVTAEQARVVADTWVQFNLLTDGSWGGAAEAFVGNAEPIAPQGTVVGYFFPVVPIGYIVVPSDNREAPAKVWSDECDLDPQARGGMAALIRDRLVALHALLNPPPQAGAPQGAPALEVDYGPTWTWLLGDGPPPIPPAGGEAANYSNGQVLTTTVWHQRAPYNNDCPFLGCTDPSNGRAFVGCVATAGAQIMRYWCWPPYGVGSPYNDTYDWLNMPDTVTTVSPAAEQAAVAELSHEIGVAVGMSYGCDGSSAYTSDMEGVYENQYRYSTACVSYDRTDYTAAGWFALISTDLNKNRPLQYRIPDHSVVCDGWRISGGQNQYHINYGWSGGNNTGWYAIDAIPGGNPPDEYVVECIYPAVALGNSPSGTYTRDAAFPYRYFDMDAGSTGATFNAGQNIQFLPGIVVECTSAIGGTVRFESSSSLTTRLFTRGDTARGGRLLNGGTIKLRGGGGIQQP